MIKFKSIKWRNFLSTGSQFTEVYLDRSSTTLIVGENGAGKSTILDAICYALFNKPFRNINKPQLVNTINQKQMEVEVCFSIGSKNYRIKRGAKPNIFEIYLNDTLLNQDAASKDYQKYLEDHVLKLNYKSFTQIVILGSASFTPFMQLNTANRREVIEDLLDIKIFSVMNVVFKEKLNELKKSIQEVDNKIELGKQKVKLQQEYILKLESDKSKVVAHLEREYSNVESAISITQANIATHSKEIASKEKKIADYDTLKNNLSKLGELKRKLIDKKDSANEEIEFYKDNETCPTCNQELSRDYKESVLQRQSSKVLELENAMEEINKQIDSIQERVEDISKIQAEISEIQNTITHLNNDVTVNNKILANLQKEIGQTTSNDVDLGNEKGKLKDLAKEVISFSEEKSSLLEEQHYLDIAGILLKDTGIKTKVIKQYLPIINKLVNKYLQAMDFFVSFELDESFNETIKSRHRDEFSYASFSEGEKAKIDLALLFAWRAIARMKNSANTNLLLLDEVFDGSLDVNGTDYVMTILNTIGDDTNVFVISHKDALFDKFRSVIKFVKHQNFSQIAR